MADSWEFYLSQYLEILLGDHLEVVCFTTRWIDSM